MYPPSLLYLKEKGTIWFNPKYGLNQFWNEYRKLREQLNKPHDYVWNHRDLKRAKEIYATSIIAVAMSKSDNLEWWMLKPKSDPPDGVIGTIIVKDGISEMHVREVEVVEHIEGDPVETIKKKLEGKNYEPNTALVCYMSVGGVFDFIKIANEISQNTPNLDHIFFVFTGLGLQDIPKDGTKTNDEMARALYKVSSIQVRPIFSHVTIDPIEDCKMWREGKEPNFFIFQGVGKGGSVPITVEVAPKLF